ncbi:hypothetical protein Sjap_020816 [Stephania japonica]|uniref:Uncharacterized protein n=1 Tax=Stephania japonica TaxID=461633 RepID=A0AAP0F6Y9_9MAGN
MSTFFRHFNLTFFQHFNLLRWLVFFHENMKLFPMKIAHMTHKRGSNLCENMKGILLNS